MALDLRRFAQRKPTTWSAAKLDAFLSLLDAVEVLERFDRVRALFPAADTAVTTRANVVRGDLIQYVRATALQFLDTE